MDSRGRLEGRQTRPGARARGVAVRFSPHVEWTGKGQGQEQDQGEESTRQGKGEWKGKAEWQEEEQGEASTRQGKGEWKEKGKWQGKGGWQGKGQWANGTDPPFPCHWQWQVKGGWQVYVDEAATHDLAVDPESWAMARDHESTHDSWFWPVASAKSVEDVDVEWQDYDYDEQGSSTPAPTTHPHRSTNKMNEDMSAIKDVMNDISRRVDRLERLHIKNERVMEGRFDGLEDKLDDALHILKASLNTPPEDPRNMPPEEAMALYGDRNGTDVDSGAAAVAAAS